MFTADNKLALWLIVVHARPELGTKQCWPQIFSAMDTAQCGVQILSNLRRCKAIVGSLTFTFCLDHHRAEEHSTGGAIHLLTAVTVAGRGIKEE